MRSFLMGQLCELKMILSDQKLQYNDYTNKTNRKNKPDISTFFLTNES